MRTPEEILIILQKISQECEWGQTKELQKISGFSLQRIGNLEVSLIHDEKFEYLFVIADGYENISERSISVNDPGFDKYLIES